MLLLIKELFVWLLNSEEIAEDWNDGLSYNKKYVNKPKNASGHCKGNDWRKGMQGKENFVVIKSV